MFSLLIKLGLCLTGLTLLQRATLHLPKRPNHFKFQTVRFYFLKKAFENITFSGSLMSLGGNGVEMKRIQKPLI